MCIRSSFLVASVCHFIFPDSKKAMRRNLKDDVVCDKFVSFWA